MQSTIITLLILFLVLVITFSPSRSQVHPQGIPLKKKASPNLDQQPIESNNENNYIVIKRPKEQEKLVANKTTTTKTSTNNVTPPQNASSIGYQKIDDLEEKINEIESGAITRGILVFMSISFFFILYVGIKTCRRKKLDKSKTVIKYGVRTRRNDLEMEPLPLSDDEEDETVFDLTASRSNLH